MFAALIVAAVAALAWFGLKSYSKALLGDIVLSVDRPRVSMGDAVGYVLELQPTGRLRVNAITVTCHGYEWIRWTETESYTDSDGKSQTRTVTRTKTHTLHQRRREVVRNQVLKQDVRFESVGRFSIPKNGPPSFSANDNAVHWCVRVDVDIPNLPDVSETFDFSVRPVVLVGK